MSALSLPRSLACALASLGATLMLAGCTTTTVKTVNFDSAESATKIAEDELLDVGIAIFEPNIPDEWEEQEAENILPDVRRAEARYLPQVLKATLEESGNWGAVRVLPRASAAVELAVEGSLLESDGEQLKLRIRAVDATGRIWIENDYTYLTSKYAYETRSPERIDPFQPLYNRIANDLLNIYRSLDRRERQRIRSIAEMRFAQTFAPDAFSGYAIEDRRGRWQLERLPAENDPMLDRIRRVREREYLFIDTLDEYYLAYRRDMARPYQDYRRFTYEEAVTLRRLEAESRRRLIAGTVLAIGGLAAAIGSDSPYARNAGAVGLLAGGLALRSSFEKRAEARIHMEAIRELGTSLEGEVTPAVIELDDRTFTLTGTVDEQYERWRGILRELYADEQGIPLEALGEAQDPTEDTRS